MIPRPLTDIERRVLSLAGDVVRGGASTFCVADIQRAGWERKPDGRSLLPANDVRAAVNVLLFRGNFGRAKRGVYTLFKTTE